MLRLLDVEGAILSEIGGASQILWSVALSPDGSRVAWTGRDRMLRIASVDGGEPLAIPAHTDQIWDVTWDEAGERIATAAADGTCAIWTADGDPVERIEVGPRTFIGPHCVLRDTNHSFHGSDLHWRLLPHITEPIVVGERCYLGARSYVMPGVTVGDAAVVALAQRRLRQRAGCEGGGVGETEQAGAGVHGGLQRGSWSS